MTAQNLEMGTYASGIEIKNLIKRFGKEVAVNNISFGLKEGELVTLLGPSGCGKTTALRCIAGLEKPDEGEIKLFGQTVFSSIEKIFVPPEKRKIGMVFQSYAVWPHLTVYQNVSYGLEILKLDKNEIKKRTMDTLGMVNMKDFVSRYPSELSGGEQQRVAVARSLATTPRVLLLDEPLSNLDAKLRIEARFWLMELQKKLAITTIYVTHDQKEAMVVSDRVIVMNEGRISQSGKAYEIYRNPKNKFVAGFIGEGNFLSSTIVKIKPTSNGNEKLIYVNFKKCRSDKKSLIHHKGYSSLEVGEDIMVLIRSENIKTHTSTPKGDTSNIFCAIIEKNVDMGTHFHYDVVIHDQNIVLNLIEEFPIGTKIFIEFPPNKLIILE